MKKLLMILPMALILCFMVGCQDKEAMAELEEFKAQEEVEEQNKELVKRIFEGLNERNADINWSIEELIAKDDRIIARFIARGTHTGEFQGIPATENKIESSGSWIARIENGKLVEVREDADLLGMMQQLGMELKPKEGEK